MNIFVDTNTLIALAKSGTPPGSPYALNAFLKALTASGDTLVITDVVYTEAVLNKPSAPDAQTIANWFKASSLKQDSTGVDPTIDNAGEISIGKAVNSPQFNGQPYSIITDDNSLTSAKGFNWSSIGVNPSDVQGTVQILNTLYNNNSLNADNYAEIRDSMNTNADTTPGAGATGDNQFYSDEKLGVTPELNSSDDIVYGDSTATPVNLSGTGLSSAGTTPDQAIDGGATGLSSTLAADGLSGYANFSVSVLEGFGKILGAAGLAGVAYDGFETGVAAAQEVESGNVSGAAQTVANFEARVFLAITGAETVGTAGAEVGAGIGFFVGGPPGAAIGGAAGGLIGSVVGAVLGYTGSQALQPLENSLVNFLQSLSGAASTAGVSTAGTYSAGINNAGGGSIVTTYGSGGTTTTTYSGPNGTGSITSVKISNATANIVSSTDAGVFEYTYAGLAFTSFQNPPTFTGTPPLQGQKITGSVVVELAGVQGNALPGTYYNTQILSLSMTDGVTSYNGPAFAGIGGNPDDGGAGGYVYLNGSYNIAAWTIGAVNGFYANPGSSGFQTAGDFEAGSSGTDDAGIENPNGTSFSAYVYAPGTWSAPIDTTTVTVSPLSGQIQQLSAVLTNPNLTAQGAVQDLTINGPGVVGVTGSYNLPNVVDNGTIAIASGASFQVSSRLVEDAGSAITGVVAGAGANTTIELAAGKSGSISSGLSNIGTIAVDAGASWTVTGSYSLPDIVDNGTIVLASGASLQVSSRLVEGAGSAITGVVAGAGASTTIELAAGKSGSISSGLSNIGTIDVDAGATWTVTGSYSLPSIVDNGTIAITNGASLAIFSALDPSSSGIFQLEGKSSLEIAKALGASSKIQFLGSAPTNKLTIDSAANFGTNVGNTSYAGPLLENFAVGDIIDLKGIASAGLALNYATASGDLQITGSTGNAVATLAFLNASLGAGTFHAASDGAGGTLITHS